MRRAPTPRSEHPPIPGGTITGIVASPRAPGRFAVLVEGKTAAMLNLDALERLGLAVGGSTLGREQAIADEQVALMVYDRAVAMLAARGRAARDLERQLVRKGEPPVAVRAAVERLRAQGLLDDEAFARQFARSRGTGGVARRRIEQELGRQGVARSVAADAVTETFAEEEIDEAGAAAALAARRLRALRDLPVEKQRQRVYGFLARRGYAPDVIAAALRQSLGAGGLDADDA